MIAKLLEPTQITMKHIKRAIRNYLLLIGSYVLLGQLLPGNTNDIHAYMLTPISYHVLRFVLALPLIFVWLTAFYSYGKLKQLAEIVAKTPEGKGFEHLAEGARWLALSLAIPTFVALILNGTANRFPSWHPFAIIVTNYTSLGFALVAFTVISSATRDLVAVAKHRFNATSTGGLQAFFVSGGVLYCYLTFRHLDLHSLSSANNPYFLPLWWLVISLIIPSLYTWFIGLLAAYDMVFLANKSTGLLYRRALKMLALGLVVVIASLISLQYLQSVVPRNGHLALDVKLVVIYAIYTCSMLGFGLMAWGAERLKRIEEV